MDLRQLSALVAVQEQGSFSAAARALHTVQSNVSSHIARLERELGAVLVDRSSGLLTDEGQAVVARARRIASEIEAIGTDVSAMGAEVTGEARIGVIGTVARWLVPPLVEVVGREHPRLRPVVLDAVTSSLIPQIIAGALDLAVVNLPVAGPDLVVDPLFAEARVLIAPPGHPLARSDRAELHEVAQHELLLPPIGTSFRDELESAARRVGVTLRAQAEVDGMRLLASLAFQGFGAAIVPSGAAPDYAEGDWRIVAVSDLAPRSVGLVRNASGPLPLPARVLRTQVLRVVSQQLAGRVGILAVAGGPEPSATPNA